MFQPEEIATIDRLGFGRSWRTRGIGALSGGRWCGSFRFRPRSVPGPEVPVWVAAKLPDAPAGLRGKDGRIATLLSIS